VFEILISSGTKWLLLW